MNRREVGRDGDIHMRLSWAKGNIDRGCGELADEVMGQNCGG